MLDDQMNQSRMLTDRILFYVCVPVYKVEKYIDACIQSVLDQTYKNFKLVLVDDGSPDQCGEICEQYAVIDSRIYVLHQKNMGSQAARENAIRFVQNSEPSENGKREVYIVWLDADDLLTQDALEVAYNHIFQSNCDLLIFDFDQVMNETVVEKNNGYSYIGTVTDKRELYNLVLCHGGYNTLWRKIGRLLLYEGWESGGCRGVRHGEDMVQSLALYKNCEKAVFVEDVLYHYTVNPVSKSQDRSIRNVQERFRDISADRGKVLRFVQAQDVWTEEDMERFLSRCRRLLMLELQNISALDTTFYKKRELFLEILEDPYYLQILNGAKPYEIILKFLQFKWFHLVVLSSQIGYFLWQTLKKIKHLAGKVGYKHG